MTIKLKDGITISPQSAKYVSENTPTAGSETLTTLRHATGLTSSASVDAHLKIPNAETRKAFEETDKGEGITIVKSTDELFRSLGT